MGNVIEDQIAELGRLTVTQLRQKYAEVFGEETRSNNKQFLYRRIAWRIQAVAEGGLSERARPPGPLRSQTTRTSASAHPRRTARSLGHSSRSRKSSGRRIPGCPRRGLGSNGCTAAI